MVLVPGTALLGTVLNCISYFNPPYPGKLANFLSITGRFKMFIFRRQIIICLRLFHFYIIYIFTKTQTMIFRCVETVKATIFPLIASSMYLLTLVLDIFYLLVLCWNSFPPCLQLYPPYYVESTVFTLPIQEVIILYVCIVSIKIQNF